MKRQKKKTVGNSARPQYQKLHHSLNSLFRNACAHSSEGPRKRENEYSFLPMYIKRGGRERKKEREEQYHLDLHTVHIKSSY
jgi:hypothetical protein